MRILTVPGYTGSGPGHWQTLWERADPGISRIGQRNWEQPIKDEWIAAIEQSIAESSGAVCLVAHSLGCNAVAHWATSSGTTSRVAAAMLVAPADTTVAELREITRTFDPVPNRALPFRSVVVASSNDPFLASARAKKLAALWNADLIDIGPAGHINTASGHGEWPEGKAILRALTRSG